MSDDQQDRWFKATRFYDLPRIRLAFEEYLKNSRWAKSAPKEGDILGILKTLPFDPTRQRCSGAGCQLSGDERFGEYFYCRRHADDMYLKLLPESPQAACVREARKFEAEAKRLGRTNQEHFAALHPEWLERLEKSRKLDNQRVILKDERPKSAAEVFYESTSKRVVNSDVVLDEDLPF